MRRTLGAGFGILVILTTVGFAFAPTPPPTFLTPSPAPLRPAASIVAEVLPAPQPLTPSLTIQDRDAVRYLATQA